MVFFNDDDYDRNLVSLSSLEFVSSEITSYAKEIAKYFYEEDLEEKICDILDINENDARKIIKVINHEVAMIRVNNPEYELPINVLEMVIESTLRVISSCPIENMASNIVWQQAFEIMQTMRK